MNPSFDRRSFLRRAGLTGVAAVALAGGAARPPARADDDLAPFQWGVASGDPLADRVLLWTRVDPSAGVTTVDWVVARDVDLADVVASGTAVTGPDRDHTVKVDVGGLESATWYFYGFTAPDGRRSLTGRTKTAPALGESTDRLRFGAVSCSNYQGGYFNVYALLAQRQDLDAILHLGDYIYEYGNGDDRYGPGAGELQGTRDHQPDTEMVTLSDYRVRHAWYKLDPDLRRLHQLYPWIATWDDHESTNNSWRDGAENHEPDPNGADPSDYPNEAGVAWSDRKAWSQRAYDEWMPLRTDDPARIWRALPYGDLAEIIVMDTRLERDEEIGAQLQTIVENEIDDPDRIMLSPEQKTFVYDRLATSPSRWKILAQQVIMGQWNTGGLPDASDLVGQQDFPQIYRDGGNTANPDQWDGYTAERSNLFGHIRDHGVQDVVVLTGDVHTSWALDLTEDPFDPTQYDPTGSNPLVRNVGVEFVVPSVTSANFESLGAEGAAAFEAGTRSNNPHVKYVDFTSHGYFILDLDADRAQADWYYVDTVLEPSMNESFGASYKTDTGRAFVEQGSEAPAGQPAPATPGGEPPAPALGSAQEPSPEPAPSLPSTGGGLGLVSLGAMAAAALVRRRSRGVGDGDSAR